ncbi:ABC transporter ATP-binding protein [Piscinibacter sakaiensis]|uniref:ABC transporter, ATP-binding protein n=1 Tax=Piscinibacter sakaiensis TaxID=1547922 RepID=A0A0K8NYG6_PISS1|nr:ABC transporter ATP-binding protein [Piscinibacter sakaiensis]GAP35426.1 ABC transporter, ATP-binding protein [Piscinibacter sakaiensis]
MSLGPDPGRTPAPGAALPPLHAASLPAATVTLEGVRVAYPGPRGGAPRTVLEGLDWSLLPGQVVGLLGRNGAGKTTLLEALLGLREAQAGRIRLFDCTLPALDDAARTRIGYVPQRADLFDWLDARQMLDYLRSFYPRWNAAKVDALLDRWSIDTATPIGRLSGGEQQRLSIIRALAHEPDLLVLDEPVASLDPAGRRDFLRELVEQVLDRGTTVVFSTHILSDLERVAFNVAFLGAGRIALQAPLDELLEQTRRVSGPATALDGLLRGAHRLSDEALQVAPGMPPQRVVIARWETGAPPAGTGPACRVEPVTLEDLFMALT